MIKNVLLASSIFFTLLSPHVSGPTLAFETIEDIEKFIEKQEKEYEEEQRKTVEVLIRSFKVSSYLEYSKEGSDSEYVDSVLKFVRSEMLDPDAAQFRKIGLKGEDDAKYVCGEVNGKNRFGGYIGFQGFIATRGNMHILSEPYGENSFSSDLAREYRALCSF